jgi:hypothetical protein
MLFSSATSEIVEFIAGENPQKVLDFKASEETRARVFFLLSKSKEDELTQVEKAELDDYLMLEHLMRLAKIKAQQMLKG